VIWIIPFLEEAHISNYPISAHMGGCASNISNLATQTLVKANLTCSSRVAIKSGVTL